ncbi:chlorite dismutase family protein [Candidatus Marsarchaeota archaeon]|nr:chlorite dismutase family protein [Candidatus Marsarchaeota archaeon]MCL5404241.1 chlorite dismutase family protein [Candidatus Marsarchaeota archaeon]
MENLISEVLSYSMDSTWWALNANKRKEVLENAALLLSSWKRKSNAAKAGIYASLRHDSDLIVWLMAPEAESILNAKAQIEKLFSKYGTHADGFLSVYAQGKERLPTKQHRYFVAYPMSKLPEWYLLGESERKAIVAEHVKIAVNSSHNNGVISYTTESFGIGDNEFVVIYELKDLPSWVSVTKELRSARARKWISNESPILVGANDLSALWCK